MLLLVHIASAGTLADDFSLDAGSWTGDGVVIDGALRVTDGRAELVGMSPGQVESFELTARVRMLDGGQLGLRAGDTPIVADFDGGGALAFGDTRWPLPMSHLTWVPEADPVFEAAGDSWEAGGVLHCEVVHDADSGTWFLYYTGFFGPPGYGYRQIGLATSPDGHTWTRWTGNPVLTIDYSSDIDGVHVHMPSVTVDQLGLWHMVYACYQNNVGNRICHATSPDGYAWTEAGVGLDRGAPGSFDEGSLRMPDVWLAPDGNWHLWYDGTAPEEHYGATGYATSVDGWSWVKQGEILPFETALQGLGVAETPWGLEAFYNRDDYFVRASADVATPDVWVEAGVVLTKGWSWWNDGYIQAPTLARDGTTWRMWYNGYTYTDGFERLGTAEGVATPGQWFDLRLRWDGSTLAAAIDGAEMPSSEARMSGAVALDVVGTAELDDVLVVWTDRAVDTGETGETGDPDGDDSRDSERAAPQAEEGCGCASPSRRVGFVAAGLSLLAGIRRRTRR